MGEHTPRRKASSASSASSGRTIKPSHSQTSNGNGGFFARFRGNGTRSHSDDEDDDEGPEAGPSDYYRRSPSPTGSQDGWRPTPDGDGAQEMEAGRNHWTKAEVWEDSEVPTPDGDGPDASMSFDADQYQKRIREILSNSHPPPLQPEAKAELEDTEDGSQADGSTEVDGVLEKTGIGEEEFGEQSPRSSAPSTPSQTPRQLSYIRKFALLYVVSQPKWARN